MLVTVPVYVVVTIGFTEKVVEPVPTFPSVGEMLPVDALPVIHVSAALCPAMIDDGFGPM